MKEIIKDIIIMIYQFIGAGLLFFIILLSPHQDLIKLVSIILVSLFFTFILFMAYYCGSGKQ